MNEENVFYGAYLKMQEALSQDEAYGTMVNELTVADRGDDIHNGSTAVREVDLDWVEAIEKALPAIDRAIREQRRFISVDEEIVPIERSRKVTNESVRHLAQHTNLIARVEEDSVTPQRILNIVREESFALYENRFLATLLRQVSLFVSKRYDALRNCNDVITADLGMVRSVEVPGEKLSVDLTYKWEHIQEDEVDIHEDVTKLTGFQRILRIRKIIADFSSMSLIRGLQNTEPVRSPIMRTNLMTKNPNFRQALELWIFLEGYTKEGFRTVTTTVEGKMEEPIQQALYNQLWIMRFGVRMQTDPQYKRRLESNYEAYLLQEKKEAELRERERRRMEEQRLKQALQEQKELYEARIEEINREHEAAVAALTADYENKLAQQKADYEARLAQQKAAYEATIAALIADYENKLAQQKADYEAQLAQQKADYEAQLAQQKADYEARLAKQKADYEARLAQQKADYEARLAEQREQYETKLQSQMDRYEAQIVVINREHEEQIATQKSYYEDALAKEHSLRESEREEYNSHLIAMEQEHAAAMKWQEEALIQAAQEREEAMRLTHSRELTDLRHDLEEQISWERAEAQRVQHELKAQAASERTEAARRYAALAEQAELESAKAARELHDLEAARQSQLAAANQKHESTVSQMKAQWDSQVKSLSYELDKERPGRILALQQVTSANEEIKRLQRLLEQQKQAAHDQEARYHDQLEEMEQRMRKQKQEHTAELERHDARHAQELERRQAQYDRTLQKQNTIHARELRRQADKAARHLHRVEMKLQRLQAKQPEPEEQLQ